MDEESLRDFFLMKRNESLEGRVVAPRKLRGFSRDKESFVAGTFANHKISYRHDDEIKKVRKIWVEIVRGLAKHTWPVHIDQHLLAVECAHETYKKALYNRRENYLRRLHAHGFKSLREILGEVDSASAHIHGRALVEIQSQWNILASPMDKHSLPEEIKGTKLIVRVEHPTYAQTIQLAIPSILSKINDLGYGHIKKILTTVGPIDWTILHLLAEQNKGMSGQKNEPDDSDIPISPGALSMLDGLGALKNKG